METKKKVIFTLLMNLPIAIAISLTAQLLALGKVIIPAFLLNFVMAYVISFIVGMVLPIEKWGVGFAKKFSNDPNSLKFGLLVNVVVNFVYVLVNSLCLTYFNVVVMGKQSFSVFLKALFGMFIPIYIIGYIVSFLWNRPANKISENLAK